MEETNIRRYVTLVFSLFGLLLGAAACKPVDTDTPSPFQEKCAALLETILKSPSSLRIVEIRESDWRGDTKEVSIVYDADNSFGATLRGNFNCSFLPDPDWWGDDKGRIDMRTDLEPSAPYQLLPYKIVSDNDTFGGSKTEPDVMILLQSSKTHDILRRRREERR